MNRTELIHLLHRLYSGQLPTGSPTTAASCLSDAPVHDILSRALRDLCRDEDADALLREETGSLVRHLRDLGYSPTPQQVARVLIGSRSLVDPRLRGLPAYRKYRGILPRRVILTAVTRVLAETAPDLSAEKPWETEDFFRTETFDHLTETKAAELAREVAGLGLKKETARLPAYMQRARQRVPRSFEPWTREERALLIEAMCYTNDAERLSQLFGRTASAVRHEGKRLIWQSRERRVA
ncbi:hypothetical protein [Lewinella sp. IMCC34183]|uniref:hypothetical protein n=1 Tax=Lewinella sp. IMCC34183 TaxID=2248762 RepID=UPI001300A9F2|nr:hypothetical protein [Lewinella sp. IMCC34183]